jgi:hypothetical protein
MAQTGIIKETSGSVIARTPQGQTRNLKAGDIVYENELIETSGTSRVVISLDNGNTINLGENATVLLDETVDGKVDVYDAIIHDVDMMQSALETGEDIDELEEETALGETIVEHDYDIDYYSGDDSSGLVGIYLIYVEYSSD